MRLKNLSSPNKIGATVYKARMVQKLCTTPAGSDAGAVTGSGIASGRRRLTAAMESSSLPSFVAAARVPWRVLACHPAGRATDASSERVHRPTATHAKLLLAERRRGQLGKPRKSYAPAECKPT